MSVRRLCTREIDTAKPNESVALVAERMHQRAVGTLVVINDTQQVIGIVTDRDLVTRVLARGRDPMQMAVSEAMTMAPRTVTEETSIESALMIMRSGRFRRIPVIDRDNRLVGLITLDDVLMLLAEEFTQIGRLLSRETPRAVIEDSSTAGLSRFQSEVRISVGD